MLLRILVALVVLATAPSFAQDPGQELTQCLADGTSGRDRKDLARWVFLAIAVHPEIKQYTTPSVETDLASVQKQMATMVMRLITETCPKQATAAFQQSGSRALQIAFETLGKLAMQELMADPNVSSSVSGFEKHLDRDELNKVLRTN